MKKEQSYIEKILCKGGYEVISGYATLKRIPIGKIEKEFVHIGTVSPLKRIEELWGDKDKAINKFTSFLKKKGVSYRNNGTFVVKGEKIISWEDYKKKFNIFD